MIETKAAIEELAVAPTDDVFVVRDVLLLRPHALPAQAHGFEGHIAWAAAMT